MEGRKQHTKTIPSENEKEHHQDEKNDASQQAFVDLWQDLFCGLLSLLICFHSIQTTLASTRPSGSGPSTNFTLMLLTQ
eukprot:m.15740 g.15740  ORF g.15740 m.15740 type:complete len:79 (-) comp7906_c0_seq1:582-818(-)